MALKKTHRRYGALVVAPLSLWSLTAHADEVDQSAPLQASTATFDASNPNLNEWTLIKLNLTDATSASDGLGTKVAVLDGKADCTNAALAGRCVNYGLSGATYTRYDNHGTHTSGIIAANPFGVAPSATILNYGVYADSGWVATGTLLSDTWKSAYAQGAQISSMSFGCSRMALCFSSYDITNMASSALPMLFVKAAGNDGSTLVNEGTSVNNATALAALNRTLIVGSVNGSGTISSFSNRPGDTCLLAGGATTCSEDLKWKYHFLVAPGEAIYSTLPNGGFGYMSGTSMATPVVAGVAAQLQTRWPALKNSPETLAQILLTSATDLGTPGVDDVYGYGLLNAAGAFLASGNVTITSTSGVTTSLTTTTTTTTSKGRGKKASVDSGNFAGLETVLGQVTVFDRFGRDFRLAETGAVDFHSRPAGSSVLRGRGLLGAFTQASWAPAFFGAATAPRAFASFSPRSAVGAVSLPEDRSLRAGADVPIGGSAFQLRLSGANDAAADFAYDPSLRPLGFFSSTNLASGSVIANMLAPAGDHARVMVYGIASVHPFEAPVAVDMQGPFLREQALSLRAARSEQLTRTQQGMGVGYWKQVGNRTLVGVNASAFVQRNGYLDINTDLPGFDRPTRLYNLGVAASHAMGDWDLVASAEITHARMSAVHQSIGFTPALFTSGQLGLAKANIFGRDGQDSFRAALVVPRKAVSGNLKLDYAVPTADGLDTERSYTAIPLNRLGSEPVRMEAAYQLAWGKSWSLGFSGAADLERTVAKVGVSGLLSIRAAL